MAGSIDPERITRELHPKKGMKDKTNKKIIPTIRRNPTKETIRNNSFFI
jgi:hypothetical protein